MPRDINDRIATMIGQSALRIAVLEAENEALSERVKALQAELDKLKTLAEN